VFTIGVPPRWDPAGTVLANHYDFARTYNTALASLCRAVGAVFVPADDLIVEPSTRGTSNERLRGTPLNGGTFAQDEVHLGQSAAQGDGVLVKRIGAIYDSTETVVAPVNTHA
jgi:hypothetical protein